MTSQFTKQKLILQTHLMITWLGNWLCITHYIGMLVLSDMIVLGFSAFIFISLYNVLKMNVYHHKYICIK